MLAKTNRLLSLLTSISLILISCSISDNKQQITPATLNDLLTNKKIDPSNSNTSNTSTNSLPAINSNDIPERIDDNNKKPILMTIKNTSLSIKESEIVNLYGEVKYSNDLKDRDFTWSVSDNTVASIVNGTLKGLKEGNVEVIATSNKDKNIRNSIIIKVNKVLINSTSTPTPTPTATSTSTIIATPTPTPTGGTPTPTPTYTPTPTPTPTATPSNFTDNVTNITGKIYDNNGTLIDSATVTASSNSYPYWSKTVTTTGGNYTLTDAPIGSTISIVASKTGFSSRTRVLVVNSSLSNNTYDFGSSTSNGLYSLQDEPEIDSLRIDYKDATDSDTNSTSGTITKNPDLFGANITSVSSIPSINISFSEPVDRAEFEKSIKIVSTSKFTNKSSSFTIDNNSSNISFSWGTDSTYVSLYFLKPLIANNSGEEAKYMIYFSSPIKDLSGKLSKTGKYIKFSDSKYNDFNVFSLANITSKFNINSMQAYSLYNKIMFQFSTPIDSVTTKSYPLYLVDSSNVSNVNNQLFAYNTNNPTDKNNATIFGYLDNNGNFKACYVIGKITSSDIISKKIVLSPLSTSFSTTPAKFGGSSNPLKSVYLLTSPSSSSYSYSNVISFDFSNNLFSSGDIIISSIGSNISGTYNDSTNGITNISLVPDVGSLSFANITDITGNSLDINSNISSYQGITTSSSQKVNFISY